MPDRSEKEFWELLHRMDEGQKFIIKNIDELKDELKEERQVGSEHRKSLHNKIERTRRDFNELEGQVIILGETAKQQAENIRALGNSMKPLLERWHDMRTVGKISSWILFFIGVSGTTLFFTARDWFQALLARLLL